MTVQPTRDQLRALADAATPGPWVASTCEPCAKRGREDIQIWDERGHILIAQWMDEVDPGAGDDTEFIAAARTAVPQLLDQLAAAERYRDHWRSAWRRRGVKHLAAEKRATRAEAQSAIRGRAVVMYRERAREAEARIKAVQDVLDRHTHYGLVEADDIRRALEGENA